MKIDPHVFVAMLVARGIPEDRIKLTFCKFPDTNRLFSRVMIYSGCNDPKVNWRHKQTQYEYQNQRNFQRALNWYKSHGQIKEKQNG